MLLLERLLPAITEENEISTDEEEIRLLAKLGSQKGQIEADEAAMISKVFLLNDLTARDLMTPRVAAPTLDGATRLEQLRAELLDNEAQWWVVLGDAVDKVLGVASRDRLLTALVRSQGQLTPADLSEPAEFVPEMIRADRLLTAFRRDNSGVRVVVDEFGGIRGCDRAGSGAGRAGGVVAQNSRRCRAMNGIGDQCHDRLLRWRAQLDLTPGNKACSQEPCVCWTSSCNGSTATGCASRCSAGWVWASPAWSMRWWVKT